MQLLLQTDLGLLLSAYHNNGITEADQWRLTANTNM